MVPGPCVVVVVGGVIEKPQPLTLQSCAPAGLQIDAPLGSNMLLITSPIEAVEGATALKVTRATLTTPVGVARLAFWKFAILVWQLFAVGQVVETVGVWNSAVFPPEIKGRQEPDGAPGQSASVLQATPALLRSVQALAPHCESIVHGGDTSIVTSTTNRWPACAVPGQERAAWAASLRVGRTTWAAVNRNKSAISVVGPDRISSLPRGVSCISEKPRALSQRLGLDVK